ncbi:MAG: type II toxin-antitoxin system VapC family toxin [Pirellulales bacterium]
MRFLLDTDICTALLRNEPCVFQKCMQHAGQLALSTVVVGELLVVTKKTPRSALFQAGLQDLVLGCHKLDYDLDCARRYGELRGWLIDRGLPASPADTMIAATALVHGLIVVTHNVRHFDHVPDLPIDDWLS